MGRSKLNGVDSILVCYISKSKPFNFLYCNGIVNLIGGRIYFMVA